MKIDLSITLTLDHYRAIAELLEAEHPRETSVAEYIQSCTEDLAADAVSRV